MRAKALSVKDTPLDFEDETVALALHALLGKLAHDLVGPLGTQLGYMDLLRPACTTDEQENYFSRARRQSEKLLDLIEHWRDGVNAATEPHRGAYALEEARSLLSAKLLAQDATTVPSTIVHAARLLAGWWSGRSETAVVSTSLGASQDEARVELCLRGGASVAFVTSWEPDEATAAHDWRCYLAKLIVARAHGRITTETVGDDRTLLLTVPC